MEQVQSPPPRNAVDRFVRRFSLFAYVVAVLLIYAVASTAIGLALAPALWFLRSVMPRALALSWYLRWPVGSKEACRILRDEADDLVCPYVPTPFYSVGQFYEEFNLVEVRSFLREHAPATIRVR